MDSSLCLIASSTCRARSNEYWSSRLSPPIEYSSSPGSCDMSKRKVLSDERSRSASLGTSGPMASHFREGEDCMCRFWNDGGPTTKRPAFFYSDESSLEHRRLMNLVLTIKVIQWFGFPGVISNNHMPNAECYSVSHLRHDTAACISTPALACCTKYVHIHQMQSLSRSALRTVRAISPLQAIPTRAFAQSARNMSSG